MPISAVPISYKVRMSVRDAVIKHGFDNDRLDVLLRLPKLGTWERDRVPAYVPRFEHRFALYDHLFKNEIGDDPIDYLEFGVYRGESLRYWLELLESPASRFVGFDTFDGLPEPWTYFGGELEAATFDAGGRAPAIADERVRFVTGLFQDSLPGFLAGHQPRSRLLLHIDADLYSSALYVLTRCDDLLVPGSIVLFDEFASVMDEFSALRDYCAAYRREYDVIACTEKLAHVAVVMR